MAVRIRLTRLGRKKRPFFRIVATDSRNRRDGAYLDKLGHYNPLTKPAEVVVDEDKAIAWLMKGATPSDTVRSLFSQNGIMMKFDLIKKGASPEKIDEEMKKRELLLKARAEAVKKPEAEPVSAQEIPETPPVPEPETPPASDAVENNQ
jgi:small subunit ribosomal protein S16